MSIFNIPTNSFFVCKVLFLFTFPYRCHMLDYRSSHHPFPAFKGKVSLDFRVMPIQYLKHTEHRSLV